MSTLHLDWIQGRPRSEEDEEGWASTERVARVTGVSGNGYQQHRTALQVSGMPRMGQEHPHIAGLRVTGRSPSTVDDGVVEVRVKYGRRDTRDSIGLADFAQIDVGSTLNQTETNERIDTSDNSLVPIEVYKPGSTAPRKKEEVQGGTVSFLDPKQTIVYRRRELGSPGQKAWNYVGTTNQAGWTLDPAASEGKWLCTGITGTSTDGGTNYDVTYTFARDQNNWVTRAYWIDPDTSKPDPDGTGAAGDGYRTCYLYFSANFNALAL